MVEATVEIRILNMFFVQLILFELLLNFEYIIIIAVFVL